MVGDADQSIYAFRGATIRNIVEFEQRLPGRHGHPAGAELPLHPDDPVRGQRRDHRRNRTASPRTCGPTRATARRSSATSPTTSTTRPRSSPRRLTGSPTRARPRPADVAVFYRTNAQSRVFEEVFIRVGLPYKVVGGVRFYERREVRDALAYLRRARQPVGRRRHLRRMLNVPKRGIGDRAEAYVAAYAERERISFAEALSRPGGRARPRDPVGQGDRRVHDTLVTELRAAVRDRSGGRVHRGRTGPHRVHRVAGAVVRPAGRRAGSRTWRSSSRWRASTTVARGRHPRRLPRAGVAGGRRRPDPRRGRPRRPGHADDPAHGQGPGVPGGVPHRDGGRGLPAPALADQRRRSWKRSAGWPTSASPGPSSACT